MTSYVGPNRSVYIPNSNTCTWGYYIWKDVGVKWNPFVFLDLHPDITKFTVQQNGRIIIFNIIESNQIACVFLNTVMVEKLTWNLHVLLEIRNSLCFFTKINSNQNKLYPWSQGNSLRNCLIEFFPQWNLQIFSQLATFVTADNFCHYNKTIFMV